MHLSCWIPAAAVNYSASAVKLIHLFFLVDTAPHNLPVSLDEDQVFYNIPGSVHKDKVSYSIPGSVHEDKVSYSIPGSVHKDKVSYSIPGSVHEDKVSYSIPGSVHKDKVSYSIPGSAREDHVPNNIPGSGHDYYSGRIMEKADIPAKNDIGSFDRLPFNQQKATQAKIRFKIISQRVHLKAVVVGKFSWNGKKTFRDKKPLMIIIQDSASLRSRLFVLFNQTRHARRTEGKFLHLNVSCMVFSEHPKDLAIIVISSVKKYESGFVSVGKQISSVVKPRNDTSLEKVSQTKLVSLLNKTEEQHWSPMNYPGFMSAQNQIPSVVTLRNDTSLGKVSQTKLVSLLNKTEEQHWSPMNYPGFMSAQNQIPSVVTSRNDTSLGKVSQIKLVSLVKKTEEEGLSPMTDPGFVSVENQTSSVVTSRKDKSLEDVSQTEVNNNYKGSGKATRRKLQLVVLNAVWGTWTSWGTCSSVCGKSGFSIRTRRCETTRDVPCEGLSFDMKECNPGVKCEAKFSDWGVWGPCSTTCGQGVRARSRVCVTEEQGLKCSGMSSLLERCKMPKCIKHEEDSPESPPAAAVGPTFPAFMKGQGLVAQKYYMFPARLVRRGDLSSNTSLAQSVPWGYEPPLPEGRESLTKTEKYLKIKTPWPPLRPPPNYENKRTSPVDPYIWGAWGEWSACSSRCGDGHRLRERLCIDHSQEDDVKVMLKWCGRGDVSEMIHCLGACSPVQAVEGPYPSRHGSLRFLLLTDKLKMALKRIRLESSETITRNATATLHPTPKGPSWSAFSNVGTARRKEETLPTRVRIIESGGKGGPSVKTHHQFAEEMNIGRAEVVETGSQHGPNVEYSPDNDKSGPLSKVQIEETGGKGGPIVRTEHEFENTTAEAESLMEIGDLRLSAETILFIVLFFICIVLLITAFCIYFLQRTIEANTKRQMRYAQPFYKPDDGQDSEPDVHKRAGFAVKPVLLPGRSLYGASFMHRAQSAQAARRKRQLKRAQLKSVRRVAGLRTFNASGNRLTNTAPAQH